MTKGFVRSAEVGDIPALVSDMRNADLAEIKASSGENPGDAILAGFGPHSEVKVACLPCGKPVAIFGVSPSEEPTDGPRVGVVWMLATNAFKALHRQFLREGAGHLSHITRDYDLVYNFTDARNTVHHRWIRWMGFHIIKRHENAGVERRAFLEFVKITEDAHV